MDHKEKLEQYLQLEIATIKKLDIEAISEVMNVLNTARLREATIYICGNGGSAATASHFVCDFNKGVSLEQEKKYRFVCLNDNVPIMMAIANDIGYDKVFEVQLHGKLKKEDILLAISGSGNSMNVVNAVRYAKEVGAKVVGVTGYDGGEVKKSADYQLHVPIDNMQITEDVHMMFDHMMMWVLRGDDERK